MLKARGKLSWASCRYVPGVLLVGCGVILLVGRLSKSASCGRMEQMGQCLGVSANGLLAYGQHWRSWPLAASSLGLGSNMRRVRAGGGGAAGVGGGPGAAGRRVT